MSGVAADTLGKARDERHPTAGHTLLDLPWPEAEGTAGDLATRLRAAVDALAMSQHIALAALLELGDSAVGAPLGLPSIQSPASRRAVVEGPRGPVEVPLMPRPGLSVIHGEVRTSAERVLAVVRSLVEGARFVRVPVIVASFELCLERVDL